MTSRLNRSPCRPCWSRSRRTGWCRAQTLVALAERLPASRRLHLLRSRYGHDAFLKEPAAIAGIIRSTLAECRWRNRMSGSTRSTRSNAKPMQASRPPRCAVRAGIDCDTAYGAVVPPLVLSSNFSFAGFNEKRQLRLHPQRQPDPRPARRSPGRPGRRRRRRGHRHRHGRDHAGAGALLEPGDTLVVPHDCYGGSWRLFNALAQEEPLRRWSPPT